MASTGLRFQSVGREICAKAWKGTLSMRPERSIDDVRTIEEKRKRREGTKGGRSSSILFYCLQRRPAEKKTEEENDGELSSIFKPQ